MILNGYVIPTFGEIAVEDRIQTQSKLDTRPIPTTKPILPPAPGENKAQTQLPHSFWVNVLYLTGGHQARSHTYYPTTSQGHT
jgi:hypothetical protein